jgi:hypothetical protein
MPKANLSSAKVNGLRLAIDTSAAIGRIRAISVTPNLIYGVVN